MGGVYRGRRAKKLEGSQMGKTASIVCQRASRILTEKLFDKQ
jgi:hypothetical protein